MKMNRKARLLNKTFFLSRQRDALNYGHKYLVTDKDLKKFEQAKREG